LRRPKTAFIDPAAFGSGTIGASTANTDTYFSTSHEDTLRILVSNFLDQIPEPQRTAVEMCVMSLMTYDEAAQYFSAIRGRPTHRKTVWRWAKSGVEMLGRMLKEAKWAAEIDPRVPDLE
jgi:DNA-directed RNA polymerase specialized sigma24 family protein